ncbi:MAG: DUF4926 domain-containing protein [Actinomycetota bacterium]|nr:DUF4926 domain-containing protein [Actinomycetota bacterium]
MAGIGVRYQELDVVAVPEDLPDAGIKAGDEGAK